MSWPKGRLKSAEDKKKQSDAQKGLMKGRPKSDLHRQHISMALTGKPKSPEHIANISKAKTGGVLGPQPASWVAAHSGEHSHAWKGGLDRYEIGPIPKGFDTPCWIWQGALVEVDGYGVFGSNKEGPDYVHRRIWEREVGPIPEGLEIDHLCCVKQCMNPRHLEPVTHLENVRREHERRKQRELEDVEEFELGA